jgi:hypothetical protein
MKLEFMIAEIVAPVILISGCAGINEGFIKQGGDIVVSIFAPAIPGPVRTVLVDKTIDGMSIAGNNIRRLSASHARSDHARKHRVVGRVPPRYSSGGSRDSATPETWYPSRFASQVSALLK